MAGLTTDYSLTLMTMKPRMDEEEDKRSLIDSNWWNNENRVTERHDFHQNSDTPSTTASSAFMNIS